MSKSVWSRIADWLQKLWRLLGQPSKPTPPVYFVPVVSCATSAQRKYLLERYAAQLHPKIRFQLRAMEHWDNNNQQRRRRS